MRLVLAYRLLCRVPSPRLSKTVVALCTLVAGLGGGACLYTDPINMPPTISILAPSPSPVWRKQLVTTFIAAVSDPNGDDVTVEWSQVPCPAASGAAAGTCTPCPAGSNDYLDPRKWPQERVKGPSFDIDMAGTDLPSCIWAFATDRHGATTPATPYPLRPMNHPPVAAIGLVNPILTAGTDKLRLYHEIEVSPDGSTDADQDPLTFDWHLIHVPVDSALDDANTGTCSSPQSPSSWCLMPDVSGDYVVQLVATDNYDGVSTPAGPPSTVTRTITVSPDQLPCLTMYDPMGTPQTHYDGMNRNQLSVVAVDDDGDPFPATSNSSGMLHFRWFTGPSSDALNLVDNDVAQFPLDPDHAPGDVVVVRVEIFDRNVDRLLSVQQACGNAADTCGQSGCNQRWTWTVHY